jgi:signal transduction histidine kinase
MKTILLIDDDQQVRTMFGLALRREGYHVIEAESGKEGLALARQHLPDLILTDIHMPGGDGATLLHDIRRDPELHSKQVVLMTGRPDLVTPRRGMEEGADDFLVKPVGIEALRNCMTARFARASINWRVEDQTLAQLRSSVPSHLPHEFFTPLAGIIGLMEILRTDLSEGLPPEIRGIHDEVYLSALRLHRTLRNYLLILEPGPLSDRETAPLSAEEVEEAVRAGVDEVMRLSENRIGDLTVRINPTRLAVEKDDLSRMVEELLDNACKYSRQGTPVTVELTSEGLLTVTDEGRGLTADEISHIGAFHQFDRKKYEQQGLGLGLVLVQKLCALCGTKLDIASTPGQGTTASIQFSPLRSS